LNLVNAEPKEARIWRDQRGEHVIATMTPEHDELVQVVRRFLADRARFRSPDDSSTRVAALAGGGLTAALAFAEPGGPWDGAAAATIWARTGACLLLTGSKTLVVDGATADLLVLSTATDEAPFPLSLFLVKSDAPGLRRRARPVFDQTRALASGDLDQTPAELVGVEGGAGPALRRALQQAAVLLSAEQLGGAQHCLDMAVEYARLRTQFGRAIGSLQAVKHRCADMLLDVETARSAVLFALSAVEVGGPLDEAASLARAHCSDVFSRAATSNVQVHGGIGFTGSTTLTSTCSALRAPRCCWAAPACTASCSPKRSGSSSDGVAAVDVQGLSGDVRRPG
jgi:alkylation response protein AidB-like acyl-CoA dehydrogenase